jgi:hypothetical protein
MNFWILYNFPKCLNLNKFSGNWKGINSNRLWFDPRMQPVTTVASHTWPPKMAAWALAFSLAHGQKWSGRLRPARCGGACPQCGPRTQTSAAAWLPTADTVMRCCGVGGTSTGELRRTRRANSWGGGSPERPIVNKVAEAAADRGVRRRQQGSIGQWWCPPAQEGVRWSDGWARIGGHRSGVKAFAWSVFGWRWRRERVCHAAMATVIQRGGWRQGEGKWQGVWLNAMQRKEGG